jgi:anti-sigma factor RsiW
MRCDEARELIGVFIDGEASHPKAQALRDHAAGCATCESEMAEIRRTGQRLRRIGRVSAPARLRTRLHVALASEAADAQRATPAVRTFPWLRQAAALAAVGLVSIMLASLVTFAVMRHTADDLRLERDVVSAHIRSLLQDSPLQVASADPHTVRPWFSGRVEFAPAVKDLAADGFRLAGARLDYVGGRRVGALVYMRRLHAVNVFVWPSPGDADTAPRLIQLNGYNVVAWNRAGLAYWAVSDLNTAELRQLSSLL